MISVKTYNKMLSASVKRILLDNELRCPFGKQSYVFLRATPAKIQVGIYDEQMIPSCRSIRVQFLSDRSPSPETVLDSFRQLRRLADNQFPPLDTRWRNLMADFKNCVVIRFWRLIYMLRYSKNFHADYVKGNYGYDEELDTHILAMVQNPSDFWRGALRFVLAKPTRETVFFTEKQISMTRLGICSEIARMHKLEDIRSNLIKLRKTSMAVEQLI